MTQALYIQNSLKCQLYWLEESDKGSIFKVHSSAKCWPEENDTGSIYIQNSLKCQFYWPEKSDKEYLFKICKCQFYWPEKWQRIYIQNL